MNNKKSPKTVLMMGAAICAFTIPLSFSANAVLDSGTFTVKAQDSKDASIVAFAGIDNRGSDPGTGTPGGEDTSEKLRTLKCAGEEIVITKDMKDFSDANIALKNSGKSSEMKAYPDGGWNIIQELDPLGLPGVAFTVGDVNLDGFSLGPLHNTSGWALVMDSGPNDCALYSIKDGKYHANTGPAYRQISGGSLKELWYKDGVLENRGTLPNEISYWGDSVDSKIESEGWYVDDTLNQWQIKYRNFDSEGKVESLEFSNNEHTAFNPDDWPGDPIPQDVWDKYWNGGY